MTKKLGKRKVLTEDDERECVDAELLEEDMADEDYNNRGCGWRYIQKIRSRRTCEPFSDSTNREQAVIAATLERKAYLGH